MAVLIVSGFVRELTGSLGHAPQTDQTMHVGHATGGLILGVSAFYLLRAFANGTGHDGHRSHLQRCEHL